MNQQFSGYRRQVRSANSNDRISCFFKALDWKSFVSLHPLIGQYQEDSEASAAGRRAIMGKLLSIPSIKDSMIQAAASLRGKPLTENRDITGFMLWQQYNACAKLSSILNERYSMEQDMQDALLAFLSGPQGKILFPAVDHYKEKITLKSDVYGNNVLDIAGFADSTDSVPIFVLQLNVEGTDIKADAQAMAYYRTISDRLVESGPGPRDRRPMILLSWNLHSMSTLGAISLVHRNTLFRHARVLDITSVDSLSRPQELNVLCGRMLAMSAALVSMRALYGPESFRPENILNYNNVYSDSVIHVVPVCTTAAATEFSTIKAAETKVENATAPPDSSIITTTAVPIPAITAWSIPTDATEATNSTLITTSYSTASAARSESVNDAQSPATTAPEPESATSAVISADTQTILDVLRSEKVEAISAAVPSDFAKLLQLALSTVLPSAAVATLNIGNAPAEPSTAATQPFEPNGPFVLQLSSYRKFYLEEACEDVISLMNEHGGDYRKHVPSRLKVEEYPVPIYDCATIKLDGQVHKVALTYLVKMLPDHSVFLARLQNQPSTVVVVKFCQSYGTDVHQSLARKGLAPELLGCNDLPGGQKMVVMRYGWPNYCSLNHELVCPAKVIYRSFLDLCRTDLSRVLRECQAEQRVLGDNRLSNYLFRKDLVDAYFGSVKRGLFEVASLRRHSAEADSDEHAFAYCMAVSMQVFSQVVNAQQPQGIETLVQDNRLVDPSRPSLQVIDFERSGAVDEPYPLCVGMNPNVMAEMEFVPGQPRAYSDDSSLLDYQIDYYLNLKE